MLQWHKALEIKHWFEDAATKGTSCVFPAWTYFVPTAPSSAQCEKDRDFIPGKSMPWRWTLPLEVHVHTVQLGSAVQTKKRQRFREGEVPANAKSVVLYCLHKADVLLAPDKGRAPF